MLFLLQSRSVYAVYVIGSPEHFYAVYAISSLDTGSSLRRDTQTAWGVVGTHQGVAWLAPALHVVYAVYAISSLDTGSSLRRGTQTAWGVVGTHQGVAGLTPRPFTLEEETGSHHGSSAR